MTARKSETHSNPMSAKPAITEPGKAPRPKQARKSTQLAARGEFGEGNYKAAREYNEGLKRHMATHDIDKEARDAAPNSREEAEDMERAEETGRSHARDEDPEVNKNA